MAKKGCLKKGCRSPKVAGFNHCAQHGREELQKIERELRAAGILTAPPLYQGRAVIGRGSLPYTFADLQFHVERFLSAAKMTPEQVFETMWATRDDWERILNYTIAAAAERLQKKAKGAAVGGSR
jgi:hypothetical protein